MKNEKTHPLERAFEHLAKEGKTTDCFTFEAVDGGTPWLQVTTTQVNVSRPQKENITPGNMPGLSLISIGENYVTWGYSRDARADAIASIRKYMLENYGWEIEQLGFLEPIGNGN